MPLAHAARKLGIWLFLTVLWPMLSPMLLQVIAPPNPRCAGLDHDKIWHGINTTRRSAIGKQHNLEPCSLPLRQLRDRRDLTLLQSNIFPKFNSRWEAPASSLARLHTMF